MSYKRVIKELQKREIIYSLQAGFCIFCVYSIEIVLSVNYNYFYTINW